MTTAPLQLRPPLCLRAPLLRPLCVRATIARAIMGQVADRVPVDLVMPDGSVLGSRKERTPGRPAIEVVRPDHVFERLAHHPKIGIGEAYMAGDWRAADGTDLAEALLPFAQRVTEAVPASLLRLRRLVDRAIPRHQRNSLTGSRRNIEAHYDLSNDLFAAFLDPTMTYSSALFADDSPWESQSLETAQLRKVSRVLDLAGVGEGVRVLEIGTGWGTLALEAARRGALVDTITLSTEQRSLAEERIRAAGLADRVSVQLRDYREVSGSYDAVVSVEMIEAVGEDYWPTYFGVLNDRLAPGGTAVVQAIVMSDQRYLATRRSYGWIQKYIFPGGLIPSVEAIERSCAGIPLQPVDVVRFGPHYAETLRRWRSDFLANWDRIDQHGFDDTFRRMWEFYLAYCEAGFAAGYLDVAHVVMRKEARE